MPRNGACGSGHSVVDGGNTRFGPRTAYPTWKYAAGPVSVLAYVNGAARAGQDSPALPLPLLPLLGTDFGGAGFRLDATAVKVACAK